MRSRLRRLVANALPRPEVVAEAVEDAARLAKVGVAVAVAVEDAASADVASAADAEDGSAMIHAARVRATRPKSRSS